MLGQASYDSQDQVHEFVLVEDTGDLVAGAPCHPHQTPLGQPMEGAAEAASPLQVPVEQNVNLYVNSNTEYKTAHLRNKMVNRNN